MGGLGRLILLVSAPALANLAGAAGTVHAQTEKTVPEQYSPSQLLEYSTLAADAGYEFIWTSDHFHPWFHTDAEADFAWSWLGAG